MTAKRIDACAKRQGELARGRVELADRGRESGAGPAGPSSRHQQPAGGPSANSAARTTADSETIRAGRPSCAPGGGSSGCQASATNCTSTCPRLGAIDTGSSGAVVIEPRGHRGDVLGDSASSVSIARFARSRRSRRRASRRTPLSCCGRRRARRSWPGRACRPTTAFRPEHRPEHGRAHREGGLQLRVGRLLRFAFDRLLRPPQPLREHGLLGRELPAHRVDRRVAGGARVEPAAGCGSRARIRPGRDVMPRLAVAQQRDAARSAPATPEDFSHAAYFFGAERRRGDRRESRARSPGVGRSDRPALDLQRSAPAQST